MATIGSVPAAFHRAVEQLRSAQFRPELLVRDIAAPERIAAESFALAADVRFGPDQHLSERVDGDSPYGAGRLILMRDPELAKDWGGEFRIVCFAQAPLEVEIGLDPFLAEVAWSWLVDALESRGAEYNFISGTATKTLSTGFGSLESEGAGAQIELRASWTPLGDDVGLHAEAWSELLATLAGLPQVEGVASLDAARGMSRHAGARKSPRPGLPRIE
jgi:hypothetical protein